MVDFTISEFLNLLYDLEHNRRFLCLRRELERRYRRANTAAFKREAYVDSVMALLWESDYERASLLAER